MNHYETVFILNPVLSEEQTKETVLKYEKFLTSNANYSKHRKRKPVF